MKYYLSNIHAGFEPATSPLPVEKYCLLYVSLKWWWTVGEFNSSIRRAKAV
jgi:hypothetical protein